MNLSSRKFMHIFMISPLLSPSLLSVTMVVIYVETKGQLDAQIIQTRLVIVSIAKGLHLNSDFINNTSEHPASSCWMLNNLSRKSSEIAQIYAMKEIGNLFQNSFCQIRFLYFALIQAKPSSLVSDLDNESHGQGVLLTTGVFQSST